VSRIGRKPIEVPAGVDVEIDDFIVRVKGSRGLLETKIHPEMKVTLQEGNVVVERPADNKKCRSLHGLTRTLIFNMVKGVTDGYFKELEINGVGYRAAKQGNNLIMNLGYSHQVIVSEIDGIKIDVPSPNKIIISGEDKQKVGQFAAEVREKRPPEPYKGKGIKYADEIIIRKEGKAGKGKK